VLLGSGALVAGALARRADGEPAAAGAYDYSLSIEPAKTKDEYLCQVSLRSAEFGNIQEQAGSFKRGSTTTVRMGEGRPDGSAIDLVVDVKVDDSGERAEFIAKITDREKIVSVQRTSVSLPRT
jgi:hypothetical protein